MKFMGITLTKKLVMTASATASGLMLWAIQAIASAAWTDHNRIQAHESAIPAVAEVAAESLANAENINNLKFQRLNEKVDAISDDVRYLVRRNGGVPATRPAR